MNMPGKTGFIFAAMLLYFAASAAIAAPTATVTMTMVDADGKVTIISRDVDPVTLGGLRERPNPATQGFDPPGAPPRPDPPSGPDVTPESTQIGVQQESNGWRRETRFERDVPMVDGRPNPGPWRMIRDHLEYLGCAKIPVSCNPM